MKKSNLIAKGTAVVLVVTTMLSTVTVAYAEDGTVVNKPSISMSWENKVGEKKMSEEDAKIFAEAMGYASFSGIVHICSEDTSADINWENSRIPMEEVYATAIIVPSISRSEDEDLIVNVDYSYEYVLEEIWNENACANIGGVGHGEYFDKTGDRMPNIGDGYYYDNSLCINDSMGINSVSKSKVGSGYYTIDISDIYVVRICYTTDGLGNIYGEGSGIEDRTYGFTDFIILPENVDTVLNLEGDTSDSNEPTTESKEDTSDSTEPSTESKEDNQDSAESTTESKENTLDSTEPASDTKEDVTIEASEESSVTEETTTVKSGTSTPDTGDSTATLVYLVLAVSALVAVLVTAKMKRA